MEPMLTASSSPTGRVTFSRVFGQQCQLMEAAVQSLHTLNDQISHFIVTKSKALEEDDDPFLPSEKETLKNSMILMRHLLMDAQPSRGEQSPPPLIPRHDVRSHHRPKSYRPKQPRTKNNSQNKVFLLLRGQPISPKRSRASHPLPWHSLASGGKCS
ncbi:putative uncharacterized protein C1orf196 [Mastomys coucha]|nr:putative uncharacterized protein C1orf196 [Mastomys coucha]